MQQPPPSTPCSSAGHLLLLVLLLLLHCTHLKMWLLVNAPSVTSLKMCCAVTGATCGRWARGQRLVALLASLALDVWLLLLLLLLPLLLL
jgi:hypothetical protein